MKRFLLLIPVFFLFAAIAQAGPQPIATPSLLEAQLQTTAGGAILVLTGATAVQPALAEPIGASKLRAQVTGNHSVALSWTLSTDDTTTNCTTTAGCTQTVYRGNGACSTGSTFVMLSGSLASTAAAFTDSSPTPGNICYGITFTINGVESVKDTVTVTLQPFAPTGAAGTGH